MEPVVATSGSTFIAHLQSCGHDLGGNKMLVCVHFPQDEVLLMIDSSSAACSWALSVWPVLRIAETGQPGQS
jgi:hypothetical protein